MATDSAFKVEGQ